MNGLGNGKIDELLSLANELEKAEGSFVCFVKGLRDAAFEIRVLDYTAETTAGMARKSAFEAGQERKLKAWLQDANSRLHQRLIIFRAALEQIARDPGAAQVVAAAAIADADAVPHSGLPLFADARASK